MIIVLSVTLRTVQNRAGPSAVRFEADRQAQYTRSDSIRISGIEEKDDENTNDIVLKISKDLKLDITENDISTSHRVGAKRKIIVKFVKSEMMRKKSVLKTNEHYKNIYLEEDLTRTRSRICWCLRKQNLRVWTTDGKIHSSDGNTKRTIDSYDDLMKIGLTQEQLREIGVSSSF